MQLSEIINYIETIAPLSHAAPWDKSGIQVTRLAREVSHLAVMLDPTPEHMASAARMGAQMVLAHHPLSMQPRFLDSTDTFFAAVSLLIRHDMLLYSAHTSLDANPAGPAGWLARALELNDTRVLERAASAHPGENIGFGLVGDLPAPLAYGEFSEKIASLIDKDSWTRCGPGCETVRRVAYCTGSGAGLIPAAAAAGADVYITGDVKYHAALESPLRVLDVGHFCLEHSMMRHCAALMERRFPQLTVSFIVSQDPLAVENSARG